MSIFTSESKQVKLVNSLAKIAILIVSAPATISLAKRAYGDVTGPFQVVVVGACVVLVELVFLYFWISCERNKTNTSRDESLQGGHILGVWLMYFILLFAGILHGEGVLSFVFRFSMGLLIFNSTREKLLTTKAKVEERFANGDYTNRKIVSERRKTEEKVELKQIRKDRKLRLAIIDKDVDGRLQKQAEAKVFMQLEREEQTITKPRQPKTTTGDLETSLYKVTQIDDQYQIACLRCNFSMLKDSRLSATRSGNSHVKKHYKNGNSGQNGHKQIVMTAVEN